MGPAKDLAKPLLDVDELLAANAARVEKILTSLKNGTGDDAPSLPVGEGTPYDDIWALRFCLSHDEDDEALATARKTLSWRKEHAEVLEKAGKRERVKKFASIERFVASYYLGE